MASVPSNPTQLTPPRVALIDERSGAISREWYRFFLSLLNATESTQQEATLAPDATSLLASYDAMLETLTQTTETQPESASVSALAIAQSDIQSLALAPPGNSGSVTSVDASGGATGLTFSGGPITSSGTLTLGGTLAITNGGTGAITAAAARTNLGATTLGGNVFTITNPSAVTFPRFNADNTVSALDAATFRTAIGAGTGSGSVTSVSGAGTVNGITLTGTVTSSGSLTLGGTLSGVSLTTQVSGTLPVANGGTNSTATPAAGGVAYGTGAAYAVNSAGTSGQVLTSAGAAAPTWTTPTTGTVTSVGGTGTVNGITLTGTVTSSGSLTLGGTLSGVSLTTQVSGTLPATNGGTGQSSYAVGDLLYASTTTALSKLADVATGNALLSGGVGVAPLYGKIGLTTHVSGTLPVANGGTNGTATPTAGGVAYGTGTAYAVNSAGTSGQVLTSAGAGAPTWTTPTTGTVTSVTGTAPVVSSGGSTPAISMAAATTSVNGYLTSTDWTTFNNKGSGTVTSVSGTGTVNGITLTGTVTSSGSLTLGGTLSGVSLTTQVSGTLPVANGGTNASTFTAGSVVFAGASGTYTQKNASFFWDNTNNRLGIGTAAPASALDVVGSITASAGIKPVYLIGSAIATVINWDGAQFYPGVDGTILLGFPTFRWNTVYATTGTINTSDGNEKQDINLLNDAEKNVAVRLKSLVRSFKFNDAVAAKGAAARVHFGLIAQDVASAFEAEGLDPQRYAMFCSDTWYEVDGKPSSDVNDPFTKETEGAVEKTRLGLRYDELIVFMISVL